MNNIPNTNTSKKSTGKVKALLLSALVFPGLGQVTQGKKALGFIVMGVSLACLLLVLMTAMGEINASAQRIISSGSMDALRIQEEAHAVLTELKTPSFLIALYSLIGLWIFSIAEIFRPINK